MCSTEPKCSGKIVVSRFDKSVPYKFILSHLLKSRTFKCLGSLTFFSSEIFSGSIRSSVLVKSIPSNIILVEWCKFTFLGNFASLP